MLSKLSVKKPYTVWVAVVLVLVLGVVSLMKITTDLLPNMNLPYAIVITTCPGASPEKIEKDVTAPIEAAMATTSNIKNVSSMSSNSYSVVILEYEQTANMDSIMIEMQQSLEQLKSGWDDTVSSPIIMQIDPSMLPIMVASADIEGMTQTEISEYVENELVPVLESIEGVASVTATGIVEERYEVTMNQDKIDEINEDIMEAIREQFTEAEQELADARDEVEKGQKELDRQQDKLADELSSAAKDLVNGKIEAAVGENELKGALDELKKTRSTLQKSIKSLNELYETAKTLEKTIADLSQVLLLDDATILAMTGMTRAEVEAAIAQAQAGIDQINAGLQQQAASFAELGVPLNTYEDIPNVVAVLSKNLAKVKAGIAQIEEAQETIDEGQETMDEAYVSLNEGQITAVIEMSNASAQLATALAQIESGEQQLEDAKESAMDSADLNAILTIDTLNGILMAQNFSMPVGYVQNGDTQYLVSVGDKIADADELENLILLDLGMDGVEPIYLEDVADIVLLNNAGDSYSKVNGNPAIMLSFEKQTGYSTGGVTDALLERFEELEESGEVNIAVLMDQGVYIDMIVKSVVENMIMGAILAVVILILFLKDIRSTIVIAASIPLSVIFAIVLMYFSGITLNLISLSGLALGIGMLVDNSIVVIENIYRLKKEGLSSKKAAVVGADQVAGAIFSSTLTTVCVFAPIIFTEGITKQLFVDIALTITYTLMASLIVALTFVPMMASGMLKSAKEPQTKLFDKVQDIYGACMHYVLAFKPLVFLITLVLLVLSTVGAFSNGFSFMNMNMEMDQISMTVGPKEDQVLTFEELCDLADETTEILLTVEGIETIGAMAGGGSTMSLMSSGTESLTYYLLLDPESERSMNDIIKEIESKTGNLNGAVTVSSASSDMTALMGSGLSVMIKGRDLDKLEQIAAEVGEIVASTPGTMDVNNGLEDTTSSFTIHVDKVKAAEYKLTVAQVFQLVYAELASTSSSTQISTDLKDYDVYVMSEDQSEVTLKDIRSLRFPYTDSEGKERKVRLSTIATFEEGISLNAINRDGQSRYISVTAGVAEGYNVTKVSSAVQDNLEKYDLPAGYTIEMAGEDEMIMDAMGQLGLMLLLAIIFIYLVMVAQFQSLLSPFIIMFTIPLAFTGGFGALYLTGNEVSVIAMIGFVMLAGVIVNNGIVMVDYINQLRREGYPKKEAIVETCKTRLRPILMTALTTILGMIPLAIGIGDGAEMIQPMAIVMIGGMVYGTLLTLVLVPCIYDLFNSNKSMVEEEL
ncbi:MAG: efflux RND transporter permease subunit [Lachnospiraceae bacterium]|nr:efflux RND transporter permease subunit [Lachnospiraceae bacterium]